MNIAWSVFDFVFEMVPPRRKPQPEIFREAVDRLGVEPGDAVMAGNDLDLDIRPALDAGYRHGSWMTISPARDVAGVTKVRTCAQLATLLTP